MNQPPGFSASASIQGFLFLLHTYTHTHTHTHTYTHRQTGKNIEVCFQVATPSWALGNFCSISEEDGGKKEINNSKKSKIWSSLLIYFEKKKERKGKWFPNFWNFVLFCFSASIGELGRQLVASTFFFFFFFFFFLLFRLVDRPNRLPSFLSFLSFFFWRQLTERHGAIQELDLYLFIYLFIYVLFRFDRLRWFHFPAVVREMAARGPEVIGPVNWNQIRNWAGEREREKKRNDWNRIGTGSRILLPVNRIERKEGNDEGRRKSRLMSTEKWKADR